MNIFGLDGKLPQLSLINSILLINLNLRINKQNGVYKTIYDVNHICLLSLDFFSSQSIIIQETYINNLSSINPRPHMVYKNI